MITSGCWCSLWLGKEAFKGQQLGRVNVELLVCLEGGGHNAFHALDCEELQTRGRLPLICNFVGLLGSRVAVQVFSLLSVEVGRPHRRIDAPKDFIYLADSRLVFQEDLGIEVGDLQTTDKEASGHAQRSYDRSLLQLLSCIG